MGTRSVLAVGGAWCGGTEAGAYIAVQRYTKFHVPIHENLSEESG